MMMMMMKMMMVTAMTMMMVMMVIMMLVTMGGSRKYPYPYHGRHLGIPKGRGGYVDWNSEDMGGGDYWTGIPKAWGDFQESNFQFGVVKSLQEQLVKNDLSKDDDSLVNTRHGQLNQHAGDTFQWPWSIKCLC